MGPFDVRVYAAPLSSSNHLAVPISPGVLLAPCEAQVYRGRVGLVQGVVMSAWFKALRADMSQEPAGLSVFRIRIIQGVRIPITTPLTRPYSAWEFYGAISPRAIRGDVSLRKKDAFRARLATVFKQTYP